MLGLPPNLSIPFEVPRIGKRHPENLEWDIEESFDLEPGEYQEIPVKTKAGTRLVGFVEADGKVSAYLLGTSSFRSFDGGLGFNYLWGREDIIRAKVSYETSETKTLHFVVSNGYEVEEDEDEREPDPVTVELKLRTES